MQSSSPPLSYTHMASPVGPLLLAGDAEALCLISFPSGGRARSPRPRWRRDEGVLREASAQLRGYFAGELQVFDLPLRFEGNAFQRSVWQALLEIPFGHTLSYGELATRIGEPGGARAVGAACGANPLPLVAPCHRVIGADGSLTGFGGGLETKIFLLEHERQVAGCVNGQLVLL